MAGAPRFKVYRNSEYVAACKYPEDAAAIAGMTPGTEIRDGHEKKRTVFVEGAESVLAADSWDGAADLIRQRLESGE